MSVRNGTGGKKSSRILAVMMAALFGLSSISTALPAYAVDNTGEAATEVAADSAGGAAVSEEKAQEEQPVQEEVTSEEPAKEEVTSEEPAKEEVTSEEPAKEEVTSEEPAKEEVTSEETTQEQETSDESTQEEQQDKPYEQSVTIKEANGQMTVTAKADAGVLPENAILAVKPVTGGSDYTEVEKKVQEKADAEDKELLGFLAYDISFSEGRKEIEPSGSVDVTMEWADSVLPDGIEDEADVSVLHLEDADSGKIQDANVVDLTESTQKNNTASVDTQGDENAVSRVEMTVDQFSVFTLTWTSGWNQSRTASVKYVDESGEELSVAGSAFQNVDNNYGHKYLIYDIDGYEYSYAHIGNTRILPYLQWDSYYRGWNYYSENARYSGRLSNNDTVYVVYKKKASPARGGNPTTTSSTDRPSNPKVQKTSTDNNDGTRTIALSIKGSEKTSTEKAKADVIVILDTSGSMRYDLNRDSGSSNRRLNAAKSALNTLADTLLTDDNNGAVQLSLINFSTEVHNTYAFTDNNSTFKNYYSRMSASGGTNWEDALATANRMSVRSDAATYVIFVTDGDPTFRNSRGDYTDKQLRDSEEIRAYTDDLENSNNEVVFGQGNSDPNNTNHNVALNEAKSIVSNNKNFYTIGIGPSVGDLQDFTSSLGLPASGSGSDSHYFHAEDDSALTNAFSTVAENIVTKLGFANVRMTDGITSLTNLSAKVGKDSTAGFTYTMTDKDGNSMTVPDSLKTAKYENNSVTWNFPENYQLEDGVTYKVEFTVWPSQEALDHVAKLNNGTEQYDSLDSTVKAQIVKGTDGSYTLKTNEKTQNVLVKNSTSVGGSTVSSGNDITLPFGTVGNLNLQDTEVTVKKDWSGVTPSTSSELYKEGVKVTVQGGDVSKTLTLTGVQEWSGSAHISVGFALTDNEGITILEPGHDFTLTEDTQLADGWTFSAGTYRPMLINGTLTMLQKGAVDGATQYTIDDNTYSVINQEDGKYVLTGTNTAKTTSVSVKKAWHDGENQDGKRPESVIVSLLADREDTGKEVVLDESNSWSGTFSDLYVKNADGKNIVYTISENQVPEYEEPEISGDAANGFTITNKHTPEKITISGTKTWDDAGNQDRKRPDKITVRLHANGEIVESKEVTADDNWKYSFTDLPRYQNGNEISYTITEDTVKDYTTDISGYDITNSYTPSKTSVAVTKIWDDNYNQDGKRPEDITVKLFADGEDTGKTVTLSEANRWSAEFKDLDEKKDGNNIVYTVSENQVSNYVTPVISGDAEKGFTITNKHTPEKITISGTKTWDDAGNQDGNRPDKIMVRLHANGQEVSSKEVTESDNWKYSFEDLPKYQGGKEISYTVTEDEVEDYTTTISGYDVTNSYTPGKTSVGVTKAWEDNNNQDGIRPQSVKVKLFADGEDTGKTVTLNEANKWSAEFTDLDEKKSGKDITYTVEEEQVKGYATTVTGTAKTGFVIANSHTPETVNISGTKTWDDANDQDRKRPDSITVRLHANGAVKVSRTVIPDKNGSWTYTFTGYPKYENGNLIEYTVTEDRVEDYTTAVTGYDVTNSYTPGKTDVEVTKAWEDDNNRDGIRPQSITVKLLADGSDTGKTVTLDAANRWSAEFTDLDEKKDGKDIVYTVEEAKVSGYTTTVTGNAKKGFVIANSHTPETINVSGTKIWDDANNQDGKRPDNIIVRLHANGVEKASQTVTPDKDGNWTYTFSSYPKNEGGKLINYTVTEDRVTDYETEINGFNITNSYTPGKTDVEVTKAWEDNNNQDGIRPDSVTVRLFADGTDTGKSVTLNAANNWSAEFTDLDEKKEGTDIVYTVEEEQVKDYGTTVTGTAKTGFTIANSHTPETVDISGTKIWSDSGERPDSITVRLHANGQVIDTKSVAAADNWKYSFTDLPKYQGGKEISYTVTEDKVEDYTTTISGCDITNTYTPGKTSVEVTKSWLDDNDRDGIRPTSVTVKLLADGKETDKSVSLSEANNWSAQFTDLDERKSGKDIVYTVEEEQVKDYDTTVTGNAKTGFVIANIHNPERITVSGEKTWDDNDNQDGNRPDSITVRLLANGETGEVQTVKADADGKWKYSFTDFYRNENGKAITYTVTEDAVTDYTSTIDGYNITNTHTPDETGITVTKAWADADNRDGIRPDSVTVKLLADGSDTGKTVTLSADNNWSAQFTGLAVNKDGKAISYTVSEKQVEGYDEPSVTGDAATGYIITNTHTPETVEVSGTKTWNDSDNQDGKRPESITVRLLANGKEVQSAKITEKEDWKYSFRDLPKNEAGKAIVYTVTEDTVKNYTTAVDGYNITNSYTPGRTSVTVTKKWDDKNNQDGSRPESVVIRLLADGKDTGKTVTLSENNNWSAQFTDLAVRKDGRAIAYTVSEDQTEGYEKPVITGNAEKGFVVTNTLASETKSEGEKGKSSGGRSGSPSGNSGGGGSGSRNSGSGGNSSGSSGSSSGTRSGSARTGDTTNIALYLILLIGAAAVLAGLALKRRKKK